MEIPEAIFLNIVLVFSLFIITISARHACPSYEYQLNKNYKKDFIRFPFKVKSDRKICGYPGFDLTITSPELIPTIDLPNSGEFSVRDIDYQKQEIRLYDPLGCLPNRLISLKLPPSSPFTATYYRNYTFLSCSPDQVAVSNSKFTTIDCLSNNIATILVTSSLTLAREMNTCTIVFEKAIPATWTDRNSLAGDLTLSWSLPGCVDCEKKRKMCGFVNGTTTEVACYVDPLTEPPSAGFIAGMVVFSVVSLVILCWLCGRIDQRTGRISDDNGEIPEGPAAVAPPHEM